jgi:rubrerythrin
LTAINKAPDARTHDEAPAMRTTIVTVEEFYAHALEIEREAAERYAEFAAYFTEHGEEVIAGLCRSLATLESEHHRQLLRACEGLKIPVISRGEYLWIDGSPPESAARELFYRATTPRQLLEIALGAEMRARAFFVGVARSSASKAVRELASIMAAEEAEHVGWVRDALEYQPGSPNWEKLIAR